MLGGTELRVYGLGSIGKVPDAMYVGLAVLFLVGSGFFLWKKGWREGVRASSVLLLVEWVFLVLCTAVIFRESGERSRINLIPLSSYFDIAEDSYLIEKAVINILNVLMFIPVGVLLGILNLNLNVNPNEIRNTKDDNNINVKPNLNDNEWSSKKGWLKAMAVGAGISVVIELLQLIFKRGLCEVDDLIHNVLGTLIGYALLRAAYRLMTKDDRRRTKNSIQ